MRHQHPEQIPEGIDYLPMHLAEKPLITTPPAPNADTAQQQHQDARLRLSNTVEGHMRLLVATPTVRMRTAELLTQLSVGEGAKVIHCTGEHLTGWITALLHTIVELPHESLMNDFMLSNAQIPQRASADASAPVVRASALQAAIYEANARYGTLQRFISDGLQLARTPSSGSKPNCWCDRPRKLTAQFQRQQLFHRLAATDPGAPCRCPPTLRPRARPRATSLRSWCLTRTPQLMPAA